ncbi:alpha/beta hydrolase fold domain-containing protein [Novipirellula sp. SH528]|uniref:alpha/beta hydrolase fold domain-containing protein n=1 Tax=Novipirellula sp. SH528 TaxID=3454466 RepID=UPI003FA07A59
MNRHHLTIVACLLLLAMSSIARADYAGAYATRKMARTDSDGNGQIDKQEAGQQWASLKALDANGDEVLTLKELKAVKIPSLATKGEKKLNVLYKQTPEEDLYLDLYYPTAKRQQNCPLVVYTHGGGWAAGSKDGIVRGSFATVATELLEHGFCVATVNYRLWRPDGKVAMRDCVIDCKDAIRYLSKNSESLGIDPQRVFSFGDSAGGQIAQMLLLTAPEALPGDASLSDFSYKMVAGVSWYGPCDFENTDLFNHDDRENFRDRFGPRILPPGSTPDQKTKLYREMSPLNYVTKNSPPLLMIQGDQDTTIPVKHAYAMKEKADSVGALVQTMIIRNAGHNWRKVGSDIDPTRKTIEQETILFLVKHLE